MDTKLSKAMVKLLEEKVMKYFGEKDREEAKKDPEACIYAVLTLIKEEFPFTWVKLGTDIESAAFHEHFEEAKEKIKQGE